MVKKNYDDMLSHFHLIPERYGRTDIKIQRITANLISANLKSHTSVVFVG